MLVVERTTSLVDPSLRFDRRRSQTTSVPRRPQAAEGGSGLLEGIGYLTESTVELVGSATAQHTVPQAGMPNRPSLADFLQSNISDASLLNAVLFEGPSSSGLYITDQPTISMMGLNIQPRLTLRIGRTPDASSLTIYVVSALIRVQRGTSTVTELDGLAVNSKNVVSWGQVDANGASMITSDLTLRIGVKMPRSFRLPPKAVERPGSLVLKQVCATQCRQFLRDIERDFCECSTML